MARTSDNSIQQWEASYSLEPSQIQSYRDDGVVKIPEFFSTNSLQIIQDEVMRLAKELGSSVDGSNREDEYPSEDIDLYRQAFTQVFNLWTKSDLIRSFISGRLANAAAELMGVSGVRVYHDQMLIKEPGGVATPWHMDHYYWPLATEKVLTAWIPMTRIPAEMGALDFAIGSQKWEYGRDIELVQQDEEIIQSKLIEENYPIQSSPYELGELSFHEGWVYHRAGANRTDQRRTVFTVIYMDQEMTLQKPANSNQEYDREKWCPGIAVGEVVDSDINPVMSAG